MTAPVVCSAVFVALLAGCAAPAPPPALDSSLLPPALQVCPDAVTTPSPPPVPRTVEGVISWAQRSADASDANARSLRTCRSRLDAVNAWISEHGAAQP